MSSDFESKSAAARCCWLDATSNASRQGHPRTSLNDLVVPPNTRASPVLSTHCVQCGSISTDFSWSYDCTVSLPLPAESVSIRTSSSLLAPNYLTTQPITLLQPLPPDPSCIPAPIPIPPPKLSSRDLNRVPTPLSARGQRKGHLFPDRRSLSPRSHLIRHYPHKRARKSCNRSQTFFGHPDWPSASPASIPSAWSQLKTPSLTMHNDSVAIGRYPTSPLSPKPPSNSSGLSPQNSRRGNHGRQTSSRSMHLNLGRYHPSNFSQVDSTSLLGPSVTSTMQAPHITYARAPAPIQMESPRLLREKHREFIEKARQSSKLAASPFAIKPDAPRLDPLGSPHDAVTPLALEEAGDYFSVAGAGKLSPAASPGARSPRAISLSSDDDGSLAKSRKLEQ